MNINEISFIEQAFLEISSVDKEQIKILIKKAFTMLERGDIRVARVDSSKNIEVNEWIKKAILLNFKLSNNQLINFGDSDKYNWYDKVDLQFTGWNEERFSGRKIRAAPGSFVRNGAYIGQNSVLMPCFINVGAYVGDGTMIDTWSTIGSCAQIGKNCHISGGVGIGGVLEPLQANPVVIGDNCFIGARSEIAEGVVVEDESVIGMGVFIGASTKIINRQTGEILYGKVPSGSVVVSGSIPSSNGVNLYAAIIVKQVDSKTRSKTSINELLRDL